MFSCILQTSELLKLIKKIMVIGGFKNKFEKEVKDSLNGQCHCVKMTQKALCLL